jgi:drug/metabolite transporter (DMT)-like permease
MIYLILSILSSTAIFIVFKLFEKYRVKVLQAIVANYIFAFITGLIIYRTGQEGPLKTIPEIIESGWFYYTFILGTLFIVVFKFMAITTQKIGLSVVSVATKMSFVIPIVFGLIFYKEGLGSLKLSGVILALISVFLVSLKNNPNISEKRGYLVIPLMVFLGSGIIDTSLKFLEETYVEQHDVSLFSTMIFLAAAFAGMLLLSVQYMFKRNPVEFKSLVGGLVLGIPNFFGVYFLVMALRSDVFDSSGIFTVNNVAIVALSTMVGIMFFRERMRIKNWIGIALALSSILLMSLTV